MYGWMVWGGILRWFETKKINHILPIAGGLPFKERLKDIPPCFFLVDFYGFPVCKCTHPMDAMGSSTMSTSKIMNSKVPTLKGDICAMWPSRILKTHHSSLFPMGGFLSSDRISSRPSKFCSAIRNLNLIGLWLLPFPYNPWDWYICLHVVHFCGICIGKYTIHGCYGRIIRVYIYIYIYRWYWHVLHFLHVLNEHRREFKG